MDESQNEKAKLIARLLRRNSTKAEMVFWEMVRDRRFENFKFYRQKILFYKYQGKDRFFITDFFCHEKKLVIEIDGLVHNFNKKFDKIREEIIKNLDLTVIRFSNNDILNNIENVLSKLNDALKN